jgi:tetraacyldisaccharide 4'-kinase
MKAIRWLLIPFSLIYGFIVFIRNKFYDWGIFKTVRIPIKSICVGNLSVGGTGKTPHVDYLIQHFLQSDTRIAVLSRGYGRQSKGVQIATNRSTSADLGDEPLQYKQRYSDQINVVVAEKRVLGLQAIQEKLPKTELIILDDAFQHRAIQAGFSILITPFDDLFTNDFMLPTGNLREWKSGKKRANLIVVSKCPPNISSETKARIIRDLEFPSEHIFFSCVEYTDLVAFTPFEKMPIEQVLLVTGIGNPAPLLEFWKSRCSVDHMAFPDHHNFTHSDIKAIHEKFGTFDAKNKVIVTTEKDYMRLQQFDDVFLQKYRWQYQPISVRLENHATFNSLLDEYFRQV